MKPMFISVLLLVASSFAFADGYSAFQTVSMIRTDAKSGSGVVIHKAIIRMSGNKASSPSCGSTRLRDYAVDLSTEGGRAVYSSLLSAKNTGASVEVWGTGSCVVWGAIEDIARVNVYAPGTSADELVADPFDQSP